MVRQNCGRVVNSLSQVALVVTQAFPWVYDGMKFQEQWDLGDLVPWEQLGGGFAISTVGTPFAGMLVRVGHFHSAFCTS